VLLPPLPKLSKLKQRRRLLHLQLVWRPHQEEVEGREWPSKQGEVQGQGWPCQKQGEVEGRGVASKDQGEVEGWG